MNIQLIGSKVESLSLSKSDEDIEQMDFSVRSGFSKEMQTSFVIIFNLKLKVDDAYILAIEHVSQFEASEDIGDEEKESHFFSINAPAIAYPFLRAFVSNILLSSGHEPVILPTINFVKLSEEGNSL